jgi:hypothetical protein
LVEQAMFFLAGLLVAGLAGLLALPAFARRALRLSEARARMLAPMSMKEVVAERDLLRAEHAVEQHRLERPRTPSPISALTSAATSQLSSRSKAKPARKTLKSVNCETRRRRGGWRYPVSKAILAPANSR